MQLVVKYIEWVCELVLQHMQLTFLFFILIYEEYVFFTIQTIKYDYLALKIYGSWSKEFKLVDSIAMKKIIKFSEIKSQLNREMDRTTMIHRSNPSTFHGVMQIIFSAIYHRWLVLGENGWGFWTGDGDVQLVSCLVELAFCDLCRRWISERQTERRMTSFWRVYLKKKCTGKTGENKSPNNLITSPSYHNLSIL